jgi:hypothetical protein
VIAKRIMSPRGGAGYQRLAGYVLNVKHEHQPADPASWARLNAYILDADNAGEKVAWARARNCQTDDPGWAVKEILATQGRNTRSRADKSYHLVVSFPEGERPTREQVEDIEDRLCAALGFEQHQRVSGVHQNTDNWHIHIAINKVHPESFRNIEPFRDHYRLQEACVELEIRHGLTREPHTTEPEQGRGRSTKARGKAADFEARQGEHSFLSWVRTEAAAGLLAARDSGKGWQELHQVAARYDLEVKLRGAGLVIGHRRDRRLHVRASNVDRLLSMQALTGVLGPYQPHSPLTVVSPAVSYARPTRTGPLYDAFKQERDAALVAREAAIKALRQQHLAYADQLKVYYRERFRRERLTGLRGFLKRDAFRHIKERQAHDRDERLRREAEERRQTRAEHPIQNWQGYLEREAANGNEAALAALRSRLQRRTSIEAQILQAHDAADARHIVYQHLHPAIRRDGRAIYRVDDGGVVSDEARSVRVNQVTTGAAFLALSLAADRFGHRPLVVLGTPEFRTQVAMLAGIKQMNVKFADITLERQRRSAEGDRENLVARSPGPTRGIYDKRDIGSERGRSR